MGPIKPFQCCLQPSSWLKQLEKQSLSLKKLLAEAKLRKAFLKEVAEGNF